MKKIINNLVGLHKSQQLRDIKKKSMIFSPEGRSDVIEFLIHHITQLPKCAIYAAIGIIGIAAVDNTSALSYSDDVGVNFTFDQSLTVSLSSADIVINNLAPGSASDSNVIDVNVLSNNLSGYTLTSTVGNNTHTNPSYDNTVLTHTSSISDTSSENVPAFTSLSTSDSISSLDDFNGNTWGYSYSDQTVATPTWTNYSGLPLYNTTGVTLKESNTPSSENGDTIKFKIAAKASTTQPSGEYRNVINFTVTAEHNPVSFYDAFKEAATKDPTISTLNGYYKMQDMSPSICESVELYDDDSHIQLIDTRDHEVYYIGKLRDDRCWLLDNLRLGSNDYEIPLTPEDTNIEAAWTLQKGITTGFNSYTEPMINAGYKDDANVTSRGTASGKIGVYYNYCAASSGTYCHPEGEGTGSAQCDICPYGWRMPTGGTDGEYTVLYGNYPSGEVFANAFSLLASGDYYDNAARQGNYGVFTSSTFMDHAKMYRLNYYISNDRVYPSQYGGIRNRGDTVRCIANNEQ